MTFFHWDPSKAWLYNQFKCNNSTKWFNSVKQILIQSIRFSQRIYSKGTEGWAWAGKEGLGAAPPGTVSSSPLVVSGGFPASAGSETLSNGAVSLREELWEHFLCFQSIWEFLFPSCSFLFSVSDSSEPHSSLFFFFFSFLPREYFVFFHLLPC